MGVAGLLHLQDMVQPPPKSLFPLFRCVVDVCASTNFFVGHAQFQVDSGDSTEATSLETSAPVFDLLIGSLGF